MGEKEHRWRGRKSKDSERQGTQTWGERESGEKRTQEDMLTCPSAAPNIGQSGADGHFLQWVALKVTLSGSA